MVCGCVSHHGNEAAVRTTSHERCTLRMSDRGMLVDGEPVSPAAAIERCKRAGAAIVVIEDSVSCSQWEPTRSALRRERVAIYMRGPVGDFRQPVVAGNAPPTKPSRVARPRCE